MKKYNTLVCRLAYSIVSNFADNSFWGGNVMLRILLSIHILVAVSFMSGNTRADDTMVIIPLWKNKKIVGDATPADVLQGKSFTSADGEYTGIRPPAPIGSDYIGKGIHPPVPRFEVYRGPFTAEPQAGYGAKDRMTGLIWRLSPENSKTFFEARNYCEGLSTQYFTSIGSRPIGVDDWRLATVKELESLFDYSRAAVTVAGSNALAIPNYFSNVLNGEYWSDTLVYWVSCPGGSTGLCCVSYLVDNQQATVRQEFFLPGHEGEPIHFSWCVRGPYGIEY
jgi:hypothetical protein